MENTVANEAIDTGMPAEQQDDVAVEVDELNLSDLMQSDASEDGTVAEPQEVDAQTAADTRDDDAQTKMFDQQALNSILGERLKREREAFRRSPEYLAGQMILQQRMQQDNITAEEALRRMQEDRVNERADMYANDPKAFYRDFIKSQNAPISMPQTQTENPLARELIAAHQSNALPQSFDPNRDVDETFVAYHQAFGLNKAIENWQTRTAIANATEVQKQKTAPQPMRVGGNSVNSPKLDFGTMSADEFSRIDRQIEQSLRLGRKVRI